MSMNSFAATGRIVGWLEPVIDNSHTKVLFWTRDRCQFNL